MPNFLRARLRLWLLIAESRRMAAELLVFHRTFRIKGHVEEPALNFKEMSPFSVIQSEVYERPWENFKQFTVTKIRERKTSYYIIRATGVCPSMSSLRWKLSRERVTTSRITPCNCFFLAYTLMKARIPNRSILFSQSEKLQLSQIV